MPGVPLQSPSSTEALRMVSAPILHTSSFASSSSQQTQESIHTNKRKLGDSSSSPGVPDKAERHYRMMSHRKEEKHKGPIADLSEVLEKLEQLVEMSKTWTNQRDMIKIFLDSSSPLQGQTIESIAGSQVSTPLWITSLLRGTSPPPTMSPPPTTSPPPRTSPPPATSLSQTASPPKTTPLSNASGTRSERIIPSTYPEEEEVSSIKHSSPTSAPAVPAQPPLANAVSKARVLADLFSGFQGDMAETRKQHQAIRQQAKKEHVHGEFQGYLSHRRFDLPQSAPQFNKAPKFKMTTLKFSELKCSERK